MHKYELQISIHLVILCHFCLRKIYMGPCQKHSLLLEFPIMTVNQIRTVLCLKYVYF